MKLKVVIGSRPLGRWVDRMRDYMCDRVVGGSGGMYKQGIRQLETKDKSEVNCLFYGGSP